MMAGTDDCYTLARSYTATPKNFANSIFDPISKTWIYLTPDLWKKTVFPKSPYQKFTDQYVKIHTTVSETQRNQVHHVMFLIQEK